MKVVVFGTDLQNRNQYIVTSIANAFRSRADVASVHIPSPATLVRHCMDEHVDLLVAVGGAGALVEPLSRAARAAATSVLWTTEDPYEIDRNIDLAACFDFVFTNDANALPHYGGRAQHLPLAGSLDFHDVPVAGDDRMLFDVFFAGTAWPERVDALNRLITQLPRTIRKKIALSGNPFLPDFHLGDLDLITGFRLSPREFARMANRSNTTLTIDRTFSGNNDRAIEGATPPPRLFELALAGTAQIYVTEREQSDAFFTPGDEIVVVRTMEAAAEAIRALSADPERRMGLAVAARTRALAQHTYQHRISTMLEVVSREHVARRPATSASPKPRVLFVTHNVAGVHPYGGVELYQETLSKALTDFDFYFLYPNRAKAEMNLKAPDGSVTTFDAGPLGYQVIHDPLREAIFSKILYEHQISLVHFHHLLGYTLSLPLFSHAAGVPSIFHFHDYYSICQSHCLIGMKDRYCDVSSDRVEMCDPCLMNRGIAQPGSQTRRRGVMDTVFRRVDAILHGCRFTEAKFHAIHPGHDPKRHFVVGSTAQPDVLEDLAQARNVEMRDGSQPLSIAIIGNFTVEKGGEILLAIFPQLQSLPLEISIVGRIDDGLKAALDAAALPKVKIVGNYTQRDLSKLLLGVDVSIHFSIWPETYCIGIDEARVAGLVPIVLGYGALAERVRDGVDGVVIDPGHPYDLVASLKAFCVDRSSLERLRLPAPALLEIPGAHFSAVSEIYRDLIRRHPVPQTRTKSLHPQYLSSANLDVRHNSPSWTSDAVIFDANPAPMGPPLLGIEIDCVPIRPSRTSQPLDVEPFIRPGDDHIELVVDEVVCSMAHEKSILLPTARKTLVIGASMPIEFDREPVAINLVGPTSHTIRIRECRVFGTNRHVGTHIDLSMLEPGRYRVVLDIIAGRSLLRYGCGTSLIVGDSVVQTEPPVSSSSTWIDASTEMLVEGLATNVVAARRLSRVLDRMRAVRMKVAPSNVRFNIDSINGQPHRRGAILTVERGKEAEISIRGWAVPKRGTAPFEAIIGQIVAKHHRSRTIAACELRSDVAGALGQTSFVRSGFAWQQSILDFQAGSYDVEIVGVDQFGEQHGTVAFRIEIT